MTIADEFLCKAYIQYMSDEMIEEIFKEIFPKGFKDIKIIREDKDFTEVTVILNYTSSYEMKIRFMLDTLHLIKLGGIPFEDETVDRVYSAFEKRGYMKENRVSPGVYFQFIDVSRKCDRVQHTEGKYFGGIR